MKQVKVEFRKIVLEFCKWLDPDLNSIFRHPLTRFHEGPLPSFDQPKKKPKKRRVPRCEQPAAFVPSRATLPVRGSLAVRAQFHDVPLELPPPPSVQCTYYIGEHSYA